MTVEGEYNGVVYRHDACHSDDAYQDYIGIKNSRCDGTKGWHDAGDYCKYMVNAGVTVGVLFLAWDHFNGHLKNLSLNIPNTGRRLLFMHWQGLPMANIAKPKKPLT
jgi:endoglucanase